MAQRASHSWYSLALVAGLGLWTLAPYGGCSCRNPMNGVNAPAASQLYGGLEAGKVPGNLVDDFNDGATSSSPTGHWQNVYVNGALTQVWFNGNDPAYRVNLWGGGTYTQADAFGSSYSSKLVVPGQPNLAGDPSTGQSGALQFGCPSCEYGRTFPPSSCTAPTDCGQIYPFIEHGMYLSPAGANGEANVEVGAGDAMVPGVDNATLSSHGLEFYISPSSTNTLTVKLILLYLANYSNSAPCNTDGYIYHQYTVTAAQITAGNGTVQIPFSSFKLGTHGAYTSNGNKIGTNLVWGTTNGGQLNASTGAVYTCMVDGDGNPTNTLNIMAVQFDPTNTVGSGSCSTSANNFQQEPYDFEIDNVEFY